MDERDTRTEFIIITKFCTFKTALLNYLKSIPDQPPLPGYPHRTNNSLTQQSLYSIQN